MCRRVRVSAYVCAREKESERNSVSERERKGEKENKSGTRISTRFFGRHHQIQPCDSSECSQVPSASVCRDNNTRENFPKSVVSRFLQ